MNAFYNMLQIAIITSIISSQFIQKLKMVMKSSNTVNHIMSGIISFIIGYLYTKSFYKYGTLYDIWIGFFTLIGAEGMYKTFKGFFGLESASNK